MSESAASIDLVAPYRLSPLGAHTDHQDGFTCGFVLEEGVHLAARAVEGRISLSSEDHEGVIEGRLDDLGPFDGTWGDYVRGIVTRLSQGRELRHGIEGSVRGDLPSGGIASSAALQVVVLLGLCRANGLDLGRATLMRLVLEAEQMSTGVPVGLLDPGVILYGKERALVFIDCRRGEPKAQRISKACPDFDLLLLHAGEDRVLESTPYRRRVLQCQGVAKKLGDGGERPVLRNVDPEQFRRRRDEIPEEAARVAEHVFGENKRVRNGLQVLTEGDLATFGRLMWASMESLTRLYGCGTERTEAMLAVLREDPDVYGASYAGGGFGGHVQALVRAGAAGAVGKRALAGFRERFGAEPAARAFPVRLGPGLGLRG